MYEMFVLEKWYYSLKFFINLSIEIFALKLWLFENDELILSLKCFLIEIFTWEINGNSVTHIAKVTNMWKVIYIWNSNLYLNTGINEKSVFYEKLLENLLWKPSCIIYENNWVWKNDEIFYQKKSSKGRQFMKSLKKN